ncbi:MAG TPA: ThuA domain-containing protein, partial [Pricia sp.]|nr:ThuA domain-containing protein [Pricia sp.]
MKNYISLILLLASTVLLAQQQLEPFEITDAWLAKIDSLAPAEPTVKNVKNKKILVFSNATGFAHWTIPHNNAMLKILARKSKIFEIHIGYDVENFETENLKKYDAVILNNSNPKGPERDLFSDLLKENTSLTDEEIAKKSPEYEKNLIDYVANGGGLMLLHGAIVVQNNSPEFS